MKKSRLQHRNVGKSIKVYGFLLFLVTVVVLWYFLRWKHNLPTVADNKNALLRDNNDYTYERPKYNNKAPREVFNGEKIVHIDLKGAPPKVEYFRRIFPLFAQIGVTGLLIEYEDMFPYRTNVSALNTYTMEDIKTINELAEESSLSVVPLIQTFGHLEFVLKLEEFRHFREVPESPQVICPSHEKTLDLLMGLVEQVLEAHPKAKMIHIGADEVYYIGLCDRCFAKMSDNGWSKNQLFLHHINAIARRIHEKYPGIRILMWDDEFRSISSTDLLNSKINKLVEPVVWKYSKEVYEEFGPSLWDMYEMVFPKVWIASAFKGATGSNQYVTDTAHHVQNHRSWMSVVSEYSKRINFQGIFITGWQRYDHFAVLCELLPVGIPSLAMSMRLLFGHNDSPLSPPTEIAKKLHCEQPYALMGPAFGTPKCTYPGGDILEGVLRLQQLKQEYETITSDSRMKGWMSDYNVAHCFSNPQYVQSVTALLDTLKNDLIQTKSDMIASMYEVYDNYTINEWVETYIKPFEDKITHLWNARRRLLSKNSWPKRPLFESLDCNADNEE